MDRMLSKVEIESKAKAFIQEVSAVPHDHAWPLIPEKELDRIAKRVAKQTIKNIEDSGGHISK